MGTPRALSGSSLPVLCPSCLTESSIRMQKNGGRRTLRQEVDTGQRDGVETGWITGRRASQGQGLGARSQSVLMSSPQSQFQNWDASHGAGPLEWLRGPQRGQTPEKHSHRGRLESRGLSVEATGSRIWTDTRAQSGTLGVTMGRQRGPGIRKGPRTSWCPGWWLSPACVWSSPRGVTCAEISLE